MMKYETLLFVGIVLFVIGVLLAGIGFGLALHAANHDNRSTSAVLDAGSKPLGSTK